MQTKPRTRSRTPTGWRVRARVAGSCLLGCAHAVALGADEPPPGTPQPPEAYVDRLMQDAPPTPELVDDGVPGFDASGAPRALRVESRAQSSSNDQGRDSSAWVSLRGVIDSSNYGAFSLDASARLLENTSRQRRGAGVSFSLFQSDMPFGGGWYASQGLGVIQTLSPRLVKHQASVFVPTRLVQGASTQWSNDTSGLTWQLSAGETGSFSSIGQGSFYGSGNRVAVLGLQLQPGRAGGPSLLAPGWSYSAVASTASGSGDQVVPGYGQRLGEAAGSGLLQSARWESRGGFVQGNLLNTRSEAPRGGGSTGSEGTALSRTGTWLDGTSQWGDVTRRWGLHRLEPDLSWQGSALGGNSQGGYYRWSQIGLRTQIEAQVSSTQAVDRSTGASSLSQAGVSLRRYINQQLGVGGTLLFSKADASSVQLSGYSELHRPWADLRLQAGVETLGSQGIVGRRVASDQSWVRPIGQRLTTSQAWNSTRTFVTDASGAVSEEQTTAFELAVAGGVDVSERLSLDINARLSTPLSSQGSRIYNVSASGEWRFAPGWSLGAVFGVSRATGTNAASASSPIPSLPSAFASSPSAGTSSRDLWFTLRYDFQAGSVRSPIGAGARVGAGGGDIEGIVFLDDNANARYEAIEARAPNVTVILDGRYTTRTDAQGRFVFPFVAAGAHVVTVASDTLPLPWAMPSTEAARVEVIPRETTRIEIGATRDRVGSSGS